MSTLTATGWVGMASVWPSLSRSDDMPFTSWISPTSTVTSYLDGNTLLQSFQRLSFAWTT